VLTKKELNAYLYTENLKKGIKYGIFRHIKSISFQQKEENVGK